MDMTQVLGLVSIASAVAAAFSTGVAVALWNTREKVEQVPVVVQRISTIERDVERLANSYGELTALLSRNQVGHTTFNHPGG